MWLFECSMKVLTTTQTCHLPILSYPCSVTPATQLPPLISLNYPSLTLIQHIQYVCLNWLVFHLIGHWVQPTKHTSPSLAWEVTNFSYTWSVRGNGTLAVAGNFISIVKFSWLFYLRSPNTFNAQWKQTGLVWRVFSEGVGWDSKTACFCLFLGMQQRT